MGPPGWAASGGQREIMVSGPPGPTTLRMGSLPGSPPCGTVPWDPDSESGCPPQPSLGKESKIRAPRDGHPSRSPQRVQAGTEPRILLGDWGPGGLCLHFLTMLEGQRGTWREGSCPQRVCALGCGGPSFACSPQVPHPSSDADLLGGWLGQAAEAGAPPTIRQASPSSY